MTTDEGHALAAFLQALAIALSNFVDQAALQDRKMQDFQRAFDGYLEAILADQAQSQPSGQEGARHLRDLLYREIERMPLHRLKNSAPKH